MLEDMRAELNQLIDAEDTARGIRNAMRWRDTAVVPGDVAALAAAVAQGLQSIRAILEAQLQEKSK